MIKRIYSKYFQKSKSFLYPALGIKKNDKFKPSGTYISIKGLIEPEDLKFICTFDNQETEAFKSFETKMLLENPLFSEKIIVDDYNIYIFDYEIYLNDWFNFILGKYSKLSNVLKRAIKTFYGENTLEYEYMHSYLNPKDYFKVYSEILNVDVETIKLSGELCDPCDIEKETLKISVENLQNLKKTT
jgi:hypothetical protein